MYLYVSGDCGVQSFVKTKLYLFSSKGLDIS